MVDARVLSSIVLVLFFASLDGCISLLFFFFFFSLLFC